MKHQAVLLAILCLFSVGICSAETADILGDWAMTSDFNGQAFESILSISQDKEGALGGYMINSFMTTEIKNVKFEDNKLTFTQQMRSMDGENESTFTGTLKEGTLSGSLSSQMGDFQMSGKKMPASPPLGKWEFRQEFQGQEFVSTLTVSADDDGKLSAVMSSQRGENELSDVAFKDGVLTCKRVLDFNGQTMEMSYKFTQAGSQLNGTMTTERGDREMVGTIVGPEILGTWMLTSESQFGQMTQMLVVYPDMSARYGTAKIKKIDYDDDDKTVSFKYSMSFGGQAMENEFSGKIEEGKLTGEMSTGQGESPVTGKKM
jgi:hypothetical protein